MTKFQFFKISFKIIDEVGNAIHSVKNFSLKRGKKSLDHFINKKMGED